MYKHECITQGTKKSLNLAPFFTFGSLTAFDFSLYVHLGFKLTGVVILLVKATEKSGEPNVRKTKS